MFIILARLAVPILIIIFGSKDFIDAVMTGKTDTLKQDAMKLGWRVIVGLFIFFIPTIANAFLNGLSYYRVISDDINQCQNCLLSPFNENYCVEGGSSAGMTDANKKTGSYVPIESTRNASAEGDIVSTRNSGAEGDIVSTRNSGAEGDIVTTRNSDANGNIATTRNSSADGSIATTRNGNVVIVQDPDNDPNNRAN